MVLIAIIDYLMFSTPLKANHYLGMAFILISIVVTSLSNEWKSPAQLNEATTPGYVAYLLSFCMAIVITLQSMVIKYVPSKFEISIIDF